MNDLEGLRKLVFSNYPSVYALCRAYPELGRSTAYQVLSGRYAGDFDAQAAKIRAAVEGTPVAVSPAKPFLSREELADALQGIRCGNCRRLDKRGCAECRTQTAKEGSALHERIFKGG